MNTDQEETCSMYFTQNQRYGRDVKNVLFIQNLVLFSKKLQTKSIILRIFTLFFPFTSMEAQMKDKFKRAFPVSLRSPAVELHFCSMLGRPTDTLLHCA